MVVGMRCRDEHRCLRVRTHLCGSACVCVPACSLACVRACLISHPYCLHAACCPCMCCAAARRRTLHGPAAFMRGGLCALRPCSPGCCPIHPAIQFPRAAAGVVGRAVTGALGFLRGRLLAGGLERKGGMRGHARSCMRDRTLGCSSSRGGQEANGAPRTSAAANNGCSCSAGCSCCSSS